MALSGGSTLLGENRGISPIFTTPAIMPSISHLSRRIVDLRNLKTDVYETKIVEVIELPGGTPTLFSPKDDNSINQMQIRPIEIGYCLIFADFRNENRKFPPLSLLNLIDIKEVSVTKGLFKRKDRMLGITFLGNKNKRYIAKINFEDKYVGEIINKIQKLKQLESDTTYWTHQRLVVPTTNSESKIIDIYPFTPFLAEGEDIMWQNMKRNPENQKKTVSIDIVTNYRIFQYDYLLNLGVVILLPLLKEVKVTKKRRTIRKNSIGTYTLLSSNILPRIQGTLRARIIGDIVFFVNDMPLITFTQITDPETLSTVVMELKRKQIYIQIGNQKRAEAERKSITVKEDQINQNITFEYNPCNIMSILSPQKPKDVINERIRPNSEKPMFKTTDNPINIDIITKIRNNFNENIIGYDDIKEFIILAIKAKMKDEKKRTHILLSGVPSTSKTVFLDNLNEAIGQHLVFFTDGSACSKSGLIDALIDKASRIKFVFIDELDKMEKDDQTILLRALESGKMQETKYNRDRAVDVKHIFFMATSNDIDKILVPLQSRFRCLNMPRYTYEQFFDISIKLLMKKYGFNRELAEKIIGEAVNGIGKDRITVRDVAGIADMLGDAETVNQSLNVVVEVWKNHSFNPE